MTTLYADRDPMQLEPYYCAHVSAMTSEGLHSKSDIAAELAWRDSEIALLRAQVAELEQRLARMLEGPCPDPMPGIFGPDPVPGMFR